MEIGKEEYAIFIHKKTGVKYATLTEKIIELEFNNKKWLWNLPKETIIKCYRIEDNSLVSDESAFELNELKLTMSINYNDLNEIFYIEE